MMDLNWRSMVARAGPLRSERIAVEVALDPSGTDPPLLQNQGGPGHATAQSIQTPWHIRLKSDLALRTAFPIQADRGFTFRRRVIPFVGRHRAD